VTARDGYYQNAGASATGAQLWAPETWGGAVAPGFANNTYFQVITAAAVVNLNYKNEGWYATGSVFEDWVTSGAPSTTPPSGHTLADIGFVVLQN
jgi:hypothetical protein